MCHKYHWLYFFIPSIFLASAQDPKIYLPNFCFNDRYKDSRLNTNLLKAIQVSGPMDCLIECDKEPCCRSINFKKKSSSHDDQNCEMLHNVVYNTSEELLETNASFDHVYFISSKKEYNASCLFPKDIDECSQGIHSCHVNARCVDTIGSYECECHNGYDGDGKNCTDIDECSDESTNECHTNANCSNAPGSYNCQCGSGYYGNGTSCTASLGESTILAKDPVEFYNTLGDWLPEKGKWRICWRASEHGWAAAIFHNQCDGKIPSLVIAKVKKDTKNFIFGGYCTKTWAGNDGAAYAPGSFLFSLRNNDDLAPFKAPLKGNINEIAIYRKSNHGPSFRRDLIIVNNAGSSTSSYTKFGSFYQLPSGYTLNQINTRSLLAGSFYFTPSEIEVLYLN